MFCCVCFIEINIKINKEIMLVLNCIGHHSAVVFSLNDLYFSIFLLYPISRLYISSHLFIWIVTKS